MVKYPIYESLLAYAGENNLPLHMPGHIGRASSLVEELQAIAKIDVTEVTGIDDLHLPTTAIKEAAHLLAQAMGAKTSLFLVNGATSGVHALWLSLTGKGRKVIIPRNAHRSFYGGLVLSGLEPVYLDTVIEPYTGIAFGVSLESLEAALTENREVAGVFLTSPSYYGTTLDIAPMAELCLKYNLPLYIDEAHGSHFPFHEDYPTPALWQGATAVVNGLHKSWPVLNQGACLNLRASVELEADIKNAASLITTTSPSFPLLASIDLARGLMQENGHTWLDKARELSLEFKPKINGLKGLSCLEGELKLMPGIDDLDPLKITIAVNQLSINGYEVAAILRGEYKIQVELQEEAVIMAMFSIFHDRLDWEYFYYALEQIALRYNKGRRKKEGYLTAPVPQVALTPRQAYFCAKKAVKLEDSGGFIAGEMVATYPPGIPCLLPGELITQEIVEYLLYLRANQVYIHGPKDKHLSSIEVITC